MTVDIAVIHKETGIPLACLLHSGKSCTIKYYTKNSSGINRKHEDLHVGCGCT